MNHITTNKEFELVFATSNKGKYNEVKKIDWNECYYRNDIGHKALKNEH